jgi:N-acetylglucosamine-6-phosphate deacetylase
VSGLTVGGGEVLFPYGRRRVDLTIGPDGRLADPGADDGPTMSTTPTLDATGLLVAPGYVDLQINGAYGIDLMREPERLWELGTGLTASGVTAFLPTIPSAPDGVVDRAREALRRRPDGYRGAEPLGLHLEGPMLSPDRRGAHDPANLRRPDQGVYGTWSKAAGVAMVTLAPELPGALDAVRHLTAGGVLVAAGHTDADADQMAAGVDAGITAVTHLFNAMAPFAHRQPGPIGVALTDRRLTAGLIVDGQHVHPVGVATAWAALGPDRLALVTDAVAAMGTRPGRSTLGGVGVVVDDVSVRTADGRLAGSLLAMDVAVRNLVDATGCTHDQAIGCATAVPARLLGRSDRGAVAVGRRADLVLLDPSYVVVAVVVGGEVVVDREGRWRS